MNDLCCPNCRRSDRVRKVSAIVAEGERYTTTITDHRRSTSIREGVTTTALAARLARPAPPRSSGCAILVGSAVAVVVGCAQLSSDGPQKNTKRTKDHRNPPTVHTFCALCVLLWQTYVRNIVMYNCSTIGYRSIGYSNERLASGALSSRTSAAELRWQRAVARWETLFYCGRCDGVFVPGDVGLAPATRMRDVPGGEEPR